MTDDDEFPQKPLPRSAATARADRVAAALRENLRRRKEQARARAGLAMRPTPEAESEQDPD